MRKKFKLLAKLLLALLFVFLVFLLFERVRGQLSLASYEKQLIAQGEKLSPKDFVSTATEDQNGAPQVFAACARLAKGTVLPNHYPGRMGIAPSGHAVAAFRQEEWVDDKVAYRWADLAADLKTNEVTLVEIRAALQKPILNNHVDLAQGMKMAFTALAPAKSLSSWFGCASALALREGRLGDALENLQAEIRLPELLAEDRLLIGELVRIAIAAVARADTWEALQADGWNDAQLAALQKAWQEKEFIIAMDLSLQGERVYGDVSYDLMRHSNQNTVEMLFGLEDMLGDTTTQPRWEKFTRSLPAGDALADFLKKQVYCRIWRFAWSHQDQRRRLEQGQRLIELARTAAKTKTFVSMRAELESFEEAAALKNRYDRLRFPETQSVFHISKALSRAMRMQTEQSVVLGAIALKRFTLRHGTSPNSLAELVPEFLPAVPVDYMDGKPLKYRRQNDGGFSLYSVGEDGMDDGGDTALQSAASSERDLWKRKDFVWPAPATPDEMAALRPKAATGR